MRVYIQVYHIRKNRGPGPYNSLRHANNRRYFSGLSLTRNRREAHVSLGEESGKNLEIFLLRKRYLYNSNTLLISRFPLKSSEMLNVLHCAIWYDLHNLKNMKNIPSQSIQKIMKDSETDARQVKQKNIKTLVFRYIWTSHTLTF